MKPNLSHTKCKYAAVTIFPNSRTDAMTMTPRYAPANMVARPRILKYAAMPAMLRLVNNANRFKNFIINYVSAMT